MAEPFTIYKLTILYMLSKAGFPLSNPQISNFFLEQEYTDYFRVQEVIGDLVDANLIHAESTHSNTQYSLTSAGKETLGFFKDKLNDGIENDVQGFFEKNKLEFRQENLTSTEPGLSCIPTENILLWGKNSANLDTAYRKRKNDTRLIAAACPSVQHIHLHFSFSSYCRWLLPVLL